MFDFNSPSFTGCRLNKVYSNTIGLLFPPDHSGGIQSTLVITGGQRVDRYRPN